MQMSHSRPLIPPPTLPSHSTMASPTLLVFLLLFLSTPFLSSSSSPDVLALLGFKSAVSHDPAGLLSGWTLDSGQHCQWHGVSCDSASGRVVALNLTGLASSELRGTLSESVGNLTELRVLSIPNNAFSGEIPAEAVGRLKNLEVIDLSFNSFSGRLPEELFGLERVGLLDLSHNQISGKIRIGRFGSCGGLLHLRLSCNLLVGRIPRGIGKCHNLRSLLLDGNVLEGRIPAEVGQLRELLVLDVSRNSLTGRVPKEIANCRNLSVLVLTKLMGEISLDAEFNAFYGVIPSGILTLPNLEILWAPRANLGGKLPYDRWNGSCKLRVLNLGQNYLNGTIPDRLGLCRGLTFLDLSSNQFFGSFPSQINVGCMDYLNVSSNSMSGSLPHITGINCTDNLVSSDLEALYSEVLVRSVKKSNPFGLVLDEKYVVIHDFSWNGFVGHLPSFSLPAHPKVYYSLVLNNNVFNGSFPGELFMGCKGLESFLVDLSFNQISGEISSRLLSNCLQLKHLDAAYNQLSNSVPSHFGDLLGLLHLDLTGNHFSGSIPEQMGKLRFLEFLILGNNSLHGEIPRQLGEMTSLAGLDLSRNALTGSIPSELANASKLQSLLLDHNGLSGNIPFSLSKLVALTTLDVSYNNLSGDVPYFKTIHNCEFLKGNPLLHPCPNPNTPPSDELPFQMDKRSGQDHKLKLYLIAATVSASVVILFLLVVVAIIVVRRRKAVIFPSIKRKVLVTFTDAPAELNFENIIKATGNFSLRNLIGMGGFGATYKAELGPGVIVAVKRLSLGKLQGLQQFDAEIGTLGRIRHKNLVTLVAYHMGEADTFLIYNYLSGGNLENFIHDRSGKNARWPVIHRIALDIAQALAFLHYSCDPRIVHRDIKPSNILLDEKLNAYLSDFGLARLLEVSETHATTDVAGTFGYVAPEYATTCRVSNKADVYSFGVVLLEMMSGKWSLDPSFSPYGNGFNIVTWAKLLINEGRSDELFSSQLWEAGPEDNLLEMLRLTSSCTAESLPDRPSMKHVVNRLKQLKNY